MASISLLSHVTRLASAFFVLKKIFAVRSPLALTVMCTMISAMKLGVDPRPMRLNTPTSVNTSVEPGRITLSNQKPPVTRLFIYYSVEESR